MTARGGRLARPPAHRQPPPSWLPLVRGDQLDGRLVLTTDVATAGAILSIGTQYGM